ncbi:recombinase family protein [Mycolicibacterium novocastrense]|nr:recombinase family protein [Mycolicibacterium novocastrense]
MSTSLAAKDQVRAACYLRISSDPNDKREGVERQREDTTALCQIKGWQPVGYYVDNDKSASSGKERPEWDRLLADVEAGKVDAIAAWDQDRGWRMMAELEQLRKFFAGLGRPVPLATTGQGDIDLYSPTGILAAQIKTAVSEHEIAMMRVRQCRAARQRAERGIPKWRKAFGYQPGPHPAECPAKCTSPHPVPDPATAPLVREAYRLILQGASLGEVCRVFNGAGAFGLNGQPWTASTASLFLRAPRNAGLRAHNGEIVGRGAWESLVDEDTWRAAQTVLDAPARKPGRKTVRRHLLTGLLQCGREGCSGYLGGYHAPGTGVRAYRCWKCLSVSIRAGYVEPLLRGIMAERLARPDAADLLRASDADSAAAEKLSMEAAALRARMDTLADDYAAGLLTGKQVKIATDTIAAKLGLLERQQQDEERMRVFDGLPLGTDEVATAVDELSPDRLRAVLDVLLTATVLPVGKGHRVANGERFDPERVQIAWK